ncbi:RibD family protein [Paenibacillus taichungensis]|uniref:RibD family protein n=1 Tax=Paenibacillus taichungensis TaxID=484184 RepID=UPI002DB98D6C|nr:RibD family protein [Paenibacillus taichungensis]MEC0111212.1 RibD family protein [Paenibacillus taichungensis]MEC0200875.1 RibD family protein [Paenibacillus taichungensis]
MDRPYIICHMLTSLDGKIAGDYLSEERAKYFTNKYEEIHEQYGIKAWICGRITMEKHFTLENELDLDHKNAPYIPRTDYVADVEATHYAIAVDPSGKLAWTHNTITDDDDREGHHIVEVLTERVSDAYLAHLRKKGVSYVFGGKDRLNFTVIMEKLKKLFSIDQVLLEGGGVINGSFLNEGLIDEISLVFVPIVDGTSNALSLFETSVDLQKAKPVNFSLMHVEQLDDGGLWMKYIKTSQ